MHPNPMPFQKIQDYPLFSPSASVLAPMQQVSDAQGTDSSGRFYSPRVDLWGCPVEPMNHAAMPDPTVNSMGYRKILPAPVRMSSCWGNIEEREKEQRLQRILEESKKQKRRLKRKRSDGHELQGRTSSLVSSATSEFRPKIPIPVPPEMNLKFVLQKELKNSDCGSVGRIIIPKRAAEDNLPYLDNKEGIMLLFWDIFSSESWWIRFRYWPNQNSRIYVLENMGDFVRKHNLDAGDVVALYRDDNFKYFLCCKKVERPAPLQHDKKRSRAFGLLEDFLEKADDSEEQAEIAKMVKQLEDYLKEDHGDEGQSSGTPQTNDPGMSLGNGYSSSMTNPQQDDSLQVDAPIVNLGDLDPAHYQEIPSFDGFDPSLCGFQLLKKGDAEGMGLQ